MREISSLLQMFELQIIMILQNFTLPQRFLLVSIFNINFQYLPKPLDTSRNDQFEFDFFPFRLGQPRYFRSTSPEVAPMRTHTTTSEQEEKLLMHAPKMDKLLVKVHNSFSCMHQPGTKLKPFYRVTYNA